MVDVEVVVMFIFSLYLLTLTAVSNVSKLISFLPIKMCLHAEQLRI